MADTVTLPGTGAVVGTDEVNIGGTPQQIQRVKLVDGTDGGTDLIGGSTARGLIVDPRPYAKRLTATPAITLVAYTAKDAVGALLTFAGAGRAAGAPFRLDSIEVVDKGQQMANLDLILFDRSITAPTDNAVFAPTDTETGYVIAVVPIGKGAYADFSTNSVASVPVGKLLVPNGTDLFGVLVARDTPTYTSTTDLVVALNGYSE
jgi:hypothetical protein